MKKMIVRIFLNKQEIEKYCEAKLYGKLDGI